MTNEQAIEKEEALLAFRALEANAAWRTVLAPWIRTQHEAAREACTRQSSTPAQRAEHIEAFHLSRALLDLVPDQVAKLKRELEAFRAASNHEPIG